MAATDQPETNMFFKKLAQEGKEYLQQFDEDAKPFIEAQEKAINELNNWFVSLFKNIKEEQKSPDQKNESNPQ